MSAFIPALSSVLGSTPVSSSSKFSSTFSSTSTSSCTYTRTSTSIRSRTCFNASATVPGTIAMTTATTHSLNGMPITNPLTAVRNNILVKLAEAPEKTQGGLFLATEAQEKPNYGVALSVGDGAYFPSGGKIDMAITQGDVVLFGKYGGDDLKYDGEKCTFITQDDVLCTFEGNEYSAKALRPVYDRVFIKVDKPQEQTSGGLAISTMAQEKPNSGTIIALGKGRLMESGKYEPMQIKVGDHVLYGKYAGTQIKFGVEDYIIVRVADIIASF